MPPHVRKTYPPIALQDQPAPSAVWTFVGGLIVAWPRIRAALIAVAVTAAVVGCTRTGPASPPSTGTPTAAHPTPEPQP